MFHFIDTIPLPTIVVNKENLIVFINETGIRFLEIKFENYTSQPITFLFPEVGTNLKSIKEEFSTSFINSIGNKQFLTIQYDSCIIENIEYGLFYIKNLQETPKLSLYSNKKEKLIKDKLQLFELFLNKINEGVLVFNTTGQLIYINDVGLSHFKLINKKNKKNFAWQFVEIFESKLDWDKKIDLINTEINIPIFFTKKDNLHKECAFSGFMNRQSRNNYDCYIITYTDISESVSDRRFNDSVLFNIPADIAVFDKNHNYIFINPNGVSNEELRNWLIGKNDFDYCKLKNLDSAQAVQRRAYFNKAKETKQEVDWVDKIVKGDNTIYVLRRFYPYYVDGVFVYMIGYGIDITELKRTQSILSEAQKQNEVILKSSLDGVILVDNNWRIIYWNPQAEQIFGWNSEEVLGGHLPEIIFPSEFENKGLMDRYIQNKLNNNEENSKTLEFNASNKQGNRITIELSLVAIDEHENTYNYCIFITDISSRKEKELKINQQNKILLQQNKELEQFTFVVSHDLQEPLLSLISYSKLLEEEYKEKLDEEGKLFVQFINKSALRMRTLISGLMQYARINKTEDKVETDFQTLLKEVQEDLFNKINKYKAIIVFENLPVVYCYPTYIRLLFQNLISNAIKFTEPEKLPEIYITFFEREIDWLFQVKDNGIGIDTKNLEQIFMIFKRLHGENTFAGTGIGLAHCKKIIEAHNGEIWVESIVGKGSTFNFTISKNI